ncbi:MAG: DNA-protecting protein DprA [Desulfovibrio sp.]|nr:DNA-protecting protein DprA [Desulfovibrio sp.]
MKPAKLAELGPDEQAEYQAILALRHCPRLGSRGMARLLKIYGSARQACDHAELWGQLGIRAGGAFAAGLWREGAQKEFESAAASDAAILMACDPAYPRLLAEIADAPALLYLRGDATLLAGPCVGIVGTRNPTAKSMHVARQFAQSLAACGIAIVSGMALGIDREAHVGGLQGVGKSIGVLGTGIDVIYPRTNRDIYERMAESGLLLSEFPPDTAPMAVNFPVRNRIISGLALGIVVIEAAMKSGSLITARLAAEQNRYVFAVPGDAFNIHSLGCQNLVRQGATPVFGPQDILDDLGPQLKACVKNAQAAPAFFGLKPGASNKAETAPVAPAIEPVEPEPAGPADAEIAADAAALTQGDAAARIISCLARGPLHADLIADRTGLPAGEIFSALLGLEMQGKVRLLPGSRYEAVEGAC